MPSLLAIDGSKAGLYRRSFVRDSTLALYLPLWHPKNQGSPIISSDLNAHSGTVTGATWGSQGRYFDNVDDKIVIPDHASLDITQGTQEAWVKTSKGSGNNEIIVKDTTGGGANNPFLLRHEGGTVLGRIGGGGANVTDVYTTTNISTLGIFYHLIVTWDGSNLRIYVNGVQEGGDQAYAYTPVTNATNIQLAKGPYGQFNGTIGEARIYSRALALREIQQNYDSTRWRYPPIPVTLIDIGMPAIDRATLGGATVTWVNKGNPANATGVIDTAEIWAFSNMTLAEVATFFVVSGNNLSTRDNENIGSVTAGSKQTFTGLTVNVTTDDYWGTYFATGNIEASSTGGSGLWNVDGDQIPCTNVAFTLSADYEMSLYGTGV